MMIFPNGLTVGNKHFPAHSFKSFALFRKQLAVETVAGVSVATGVGLEYCAIDLVMGACDALVKSTDTTQLPPLGWRIDSISSKASYPDGRGNITPFQPRVPDGWLLCESAKAWYFFPLKLLDIVIRQNRALSLVFGGRMMRLSLDATERATAEFDAFRSHAYRSRHYTVRPQTDYADLRPIERLRCRSVHLEPFNPGDDLAELEFDELWVSPNRTDRTPIPRTPPQPKIGR